MVVANNQKTKRWNKNEMLIALDDIHDKYPKLPSTQVETFSYVYYPIAIIEMDLDEMTFEDFESVQLAVLRFIGAGQKEHAVIADTMGLSPNYVYRLMHLLAGYGHIDEKGITPLGKESLNQGKKIVKSRVLERFQVDALNGCLLKVEQIISDDILDEKDQTNIHLGFIDYLDGISVEALNEQLNQDSYNNFIKGKRGILNTNVTEIYDVKCLEIKYAKCFIMKLRGCIDPIVFAKRYDMNKKDIKERFSWQPFSVENEKIKIKYGLELEIPISSPTAKSYITNFYNLLMERAMKVDLKKEIPYVMKKVYPFEDKGVQIARIKGVKVPIVNVDEYAFEKYRSWIPNFLLRIQKDGEYIITNHSLYGHLISLRTESLKMMDVAQRMQDTTKKYDRLKVIKMLRDELRDFDSSGRKLLLDEIDRVLETF